MLTTKQEHRKFKRQNIRELNQLTELLIDLKEAERKGW
jgi:hypothetical protein